MNHNQSKNTDQKEEKKSILPSINLPKGGGAINGIGEKFQVNAVTGTGSASIPIPVSPGRNGFAPQLSLSYDSGSGNSPFGLGWNISIPSIIRKTAKGLPQYNDAEESDTFILSGAEDLVPFLDEKNNWERKIRIDLDPDHTVYYYRPRTEGLFARIEKWVHKTNGNVFWKTTSKENITSYYGRSNETRIYDSANPNRIFEWLLEESRDNLGNVIAYTYKSEDQIGIDPSKPSEQHRFKYQPAFNQKYIKKICYCNTASDQTNKWHFQIAFDYGEHNQTTPTINEEKDWNIRLDPFSSYNSGFEIRTYRLCERILLFHEFPELGSEPVLVRSTNLEYDKATDLTQLKEAWQVGYIKNGDNYSTKSTPKVKYTYSQPEIGNKIEEISVDNLQNLPVGVDGIEYHWVDLEGEGIDGILSEQAGSWFYKSNLGNGEFSDTKLLSSRPSLIGNGNPQLQDLDSDGEKELLIMQSSLSGFYSYSNDKWKNYQPFENMPNINWQDPNIKFLDLNGDGFADILITEDDLLRWFPSKAKQGYDTSRTIAKPIDENEGPRIIFSDPDQSIYLADMSGSGLSDIVRIRNKDICYWPNLGYGNFGPKIVMDNAPLIDHQDHFHQKNIRLTDINGNGTTDILYLSKQGVKIWYNQAGNGWSDENAIPVFPDTNNITDVQVADLLGKGTPCLVWSSPLPNDQGRHLKYVDLMSAGKPFLLTETENNMGAKTIVSYAPSTRFYLEDKKAGNPWITKLPFPVYVIEKIEIIDLIGNAKLATSYKYHHGYYDGEEREFRGFGMVEQVDAESFDEKSSDSTDNIHFIPPILTKTWFHTGAYVKQETISCQYKKEYYQLDTEAYHLPDSEIIYKEAPNYISTREACRALRGQVLRTEIYALDNSDKSTHPYTVTESSFTIQQLQPIETNKFGVYLTYSKEGFTHHYERFNKDPRMAHSITVDVNEYGAVTQSAQIVYPRRNGHPEIYPEQQQLHILLQESLIHNHDEDDFYFLGISKSQKSFEVSGLVPDDRYFNIEFFIKKINDSKEISFTDIPQIIIPEKRLLNWSVNYYWNSPGTKIIEDEKYEWPILLHNTENAIFTPDLIEDIYKTVLNNQYIETEGKYILKSGYWWNPGVVQLYLKKENFYHLYATKDPWENRTWIKYDNYNLIPICSFDTLENSTLVSVDYRTLSAYKQIDVNNNISEVVTDALGNVIATSMQGKEENESGEISDKGDLSIKFYNIVNPDLSNPIEDIIENPMRFLQDVTSYFFYNLNCFEENEQPPQYISLSREKHVKDLSPNENFNIHIVIGYFDGFGRNVQQKIKVEPGVSYISDQQGGLILDEENKPQKQWSEVRWLSSGRTIYNNKEKPIKQYEPFYISWHGYEKEKRMTQIGVTPIIHYDPLSRTVRTDTPNGFYSEIKFNSWESATYDMNDTIKDSEYWKKNYNDPTFSKEEKTTLEKAESHYNTPNVAIFDTLGRTFISYGVKEDITKYPNTKKFITYTEFSITNQSLTQTDPRQYELNKSRGQKIRNFTHKYDMLGNALSTNSIDSGESRSFVNIMGNPIWSQNSRNIINTVEYDLLHRPIKIWSKGEYTDNKKLVQKIVYGTKDSGINKNLQLIAHYDQTGLKTLEKLSFKGEHLKVSKKFNKKYKDIVDWNSPSDQEVEEEEFNTESKYNALGRIILSVAPDGSISKPVFNFSGKLTQVLIDLHGKNAFKEYVKNIEYNEKGQRINIQYGNGTSTNYEYWPVNYQLKTIHTTRENGNTHLQWLNYWQDPVGNITEIKDSAQSDIYFRGNVVKAENEYWYDAFYQLIKTTGREHTGQNQSYDQMDEFRTNLQHTNDGSVMNRYEQFFEYDEAGNKLSIKHHPLLNNVSDWKRNFVYDDISNRLKKSTTASISETYSYDNNGNMLNIATVNTLVWNYTDEISYLKRGTTEAWYNYDHTGQRCRKVVKEGIKTKIRYYIGQYEVYREYDGSVLELERQSLHVSDDSNRIALIETKTIHEENVIRETLIRYQYGNHIGSASLELDNKAAIISYEEYYPYGCSSYQAVDKTREVPTKRYRYTGMERDEESGLNYHAARYYAPWLSRWLCPDPAGTVDGLNLYRYLSGNPINFMDTNGTWEESGHYYTVYLVSLAAGFDPETAFRNAFYAQMPDEVNELDAKATVMKHFGRAMGPPFSPPTLETTTTTDDFLHSDYVGKGQHALTGGDPTKERKEFSEKLKAATPGSLEYGLLLHRFGDLYAHVDSSGKLYPMPFGHAADNLTGNSPDDIVRSKDRYLDYMIAMYDVMVAGNPNKPAMSREEFIAMAHNLINDLQYRYAHTETVVKPNPLFLLPIPGMLPVTFEQKIVQGSMDRLDEQIALIREYAKTRLGVEMNKNKPEDHGMSSFNDYQRKFNHLLKDAKLSDIIKLYKEWAGYSVNGNAPAQQKPFDWRTAPPTLPAQPMQELFPNNGR